PGGGVRLEEFQGLNVPSEAEEEGERSCMFNSSSSAGRDLPADCREFTRNRRRTSREHAGKAWAQEGGYEGNQLGVCCIVCMLRPLTCREFNWFCWDNMGRIQEFL
ncbi:hypothetical protein GOODEAATRI_005898, partial [Goodea atripinnis]